MYHQQMQQSAQPQIPQSGQVPGSYGPQGMHPGQPPRMTFDPSKGHPVPSSVGNAPAPSGADSQLKAAESGIPEGSQPDQKLQGAKSDINSPPKLSVSSLDEKAEEHDNIADFLGNVIKYRVIIEKMIIIWIQILNVDLRFQQYSRYNYVVSFIG